MKRVCCITKYVLGLALVCLCSLRAHCASVVISPSSITNDFKGTIVLSITGLPSGGTVAVEEYLDANGNGTVDSPQEALVRAFTVTDGQVTSIGGVRDLDVPGDDDGLTNGQIRVELPYPGLSETLSHIAGNYLVRVYDPTNGFSPLTNSFVIMQKVYPQGATGQVTASDTGAPLSNAVVVMVAQNGPGFGTVADGSGNFTIYGTPGNYFLVAIANGFVNDQGAGGVTISSNLFASKNITNLAANRTISGKLSDSASGLGLPGIFVESETSDNLFAPAFSDASGQFTIPALPGDWKVKVGHDSGVAQLGYLATETSIRTNVTLGSASNINFQFVKPSALIYGSVRDDHSNAVSGRSIWSDDFSFTYQASGASDDHGNYSLGAFAADWNLGLDNGELAALNLIGQGANLTVTNGQALRQDFTLQHAGAHLRGRVIDTTGAPLGQVTLIVQLFNGQGPGLASVYPQTGSDGSFDAGVYAGHWNIALECGSASDHGVVGPSLYFDVIDGVDQNNITLIAQAATGQLTGTVLDSHGTPLDVQTYGNLILNGTNYSSCGGSTDANGRYQFPVCPGLWQVGISGDLTSRGYDNPPNQSVLVSGSNAVANITIYPLGQTPPSLTQAGYYNGHFQFRLTGRPDQKYRIEVTTNVNNPSSWIILRTNTAFGGVFDFIDANSPPVPPRFYLAILVP